MPARPGVVAPRPGPTGLRRGRQEDPGDLEPCRSEHGWAPSKYSLAPSILDVSLCTREARTEPMHGPLNAVRARQPRNGGVKLVRNIRHESVIEDDARTMRRPNALIGAVGRGGGGNALTAASSRCTWHILRRGDCRSDPM